MTHWSEVSFGSHKGKTLPQIAFLEPDWLFWAVETGACHGALHREAAEVERRARCIRIPNDPAGLLVAKYLFDPITGKFSHLQIVPATRPLHEGAGRTMRKPFIDLSVPRSISEYDKLGGSILTSRVRNLFFGDGSKMSRARADSFFASKNNFALVKLRRCRMGANCSAPTRSLACDV